MSLYPTKTRLRLLAAVANDQVDTDITAEHDRVLYFPHAPTSFQDRTAVTARARELEQAGWVVESETGRWSVTDTGRAVLAEAVLSA